jgi:hypothetical protein
MILNRFTSHRAVKTSQMWSRDSAAVQDGLAAENRSRFLSESFALDAPLYPAVTLRQAPPGPRLVLGHLLCCLQLVQQLEGTNRLVLVMRRVSRTIKHNVNPSGLYGSWKSMPRLETRYGLKNFLKQTQWVVPRVVSLGRWSCWLVHDDQSSSRFWVSWQKLLSSQSRRLMSK